jgi:hypothetical protein
MLIAWSKTTAEAHTAENFSTLLNGFSPLTHCITSSWLLTHFDPLHLELQNIFFWMKEAKIMEAKFLNFIKLM